MSRFISTWSVASVFNRWNSEGVRGDWVVNVEQEITTRGGRLAEADCQPADIVADVIRALGYTVICGHHPFSGETHWSDGGGYIIMSIQNSAGDYIYGSLYTTAEAQRWQGAVVKNNHTRPLGGHRALWDWAAWQTGQARAGAVDLNTAIRKESIIRAIDGGAQAVAANRHEKEYLRLLYDAHLNEEDVAKIRSTHEKTGISTIGNTLPPDIVAALQSFRHDDVAFRTEGEWEFYIPEFMRAVMACPVAEEVAHVDEVGTSTCPPPSSPGAADSSSDDDEE